MTGLVLVVIVLAMQRNIIDAKKTNACGVTTTTTLQSDPGLEGAKAVVLSRTFRCFHLIAVRQQFNHFVLPAPFFPVPPFLLLM